MAPVMAATRYGLLASAIARRRLGVVSCDVTRAYAAGDVIHIPAGQAPRWETVALQAALLHGGSLALQVAARLPLRRIVRHRYLTLEAARLVALDPLLPPRVCALVVATYAGPVPASVEESFRRAADSRAQVPEAPEWMGTIRPLELRRPGATGEPSNADLWGRAQCDESMSAPGDEDAERSRILERLSSPIAMGSPLARMVQQLLRAGRAPSGGAGGQELPVRAARRGEPGTGARVTQSVSRAWAALAGDQPPSRWYPEWDERHRRYRSEWCAVAEYDPHQRDATETFDPGVDRPLRVQLARLGLEHARCRRRPDGDSLDATALVDFAVDRAATGSADPRVYERRERAVRDLGVLVLVDATGSTAESIEGHEVFDRQRRLAAHLTAALDELGDRVATYGFYSYGRSSVRYLRIKGFDDRYDGAAAARLAALQPGGFTRLGAALRHGTHLLMTGAGTSKLMLIVVGDAFPYDDGYELDYAWADSRRALDEAVAQGVGCVCLSLGASTDHETVERVWGNVPHRQIGESSELAPHVRRLFSDSLRQAAAHGVWGLPA
jgi:nitric oxide reductase NorD protein